MYESIITSEWPNFQNNFLWNGCLDPVWDINQVYGENEMHFLHVNLIPLMTNVIYSMMHEWNSSSQDEYVVGYGTIGVWAYIMKCLKFDKQVRKNMGSLLSYWKGKNKGRLIYLQSISFFLPFFYPYKDFLMDYENVHLECG